MFAPASVAVIGATERPGSVGRSVLWNLLSSPFGGTVFPVNSKRAKCAGNQGLSQCRRPARKVDLVVVTTPADTVPDVLGEVRWRSAFRRGIVISAGFKEYGEHGKELERQICEIDPRQDAR